MGHTTINCLSDFKPAFFRAAVRMMLIISSIALLTSCAYRFTGSEGPPRGLEKVFIQLLENKTTEPDINILITNELKNEFIQKYRGILVDREHAGAILSGAVVGIRTETVVRRGDLTSLERRVFMTIDLKLKSFGSERIWFARGISDNDTYPVAAANKEATEQNKREALQGLARRIAEISFHRLSDDF